jgi:hypothetical protein
MLNLEERPIGSERWVRSARASQEREITVIGQYIQVPEGLQAQLKWLGPTVAVLLLMASLAACSTQGSSGREGGSSVKAPIVFRDSNYGPLSFNGRTGADFYISQAGHFAPGGIANGAIEIHLRGSSFQVGYNGEQLNICLAQIPFAEVRSDPRGFKASCLAGAMAGAHRPGQLLVFSGAKWSDGNTEFGNDASSLRVDPMPGYGAADQINELVFTSSTSDLAHFEGTLYGYIVVYKQHERSNADIAPIRLKFE